MRQFYGQYISNIEKFHENTFLIIWLQPIFNQNDISLFAISDHIFQAFLE